MNHDEYRTRFETATDAEAPAILAHAESCAACRRDRRTAEKALAVLEGGRSAARGSRLEEAASVAAVVAMFAIALSGLWTDRNARRAPAAPAARYRIVGGPEGVVAYTPTETIVASGGGAHASNDEKENHR